MGRTTRSLEELSMTGVVLAGGEGKRLGFSYNKQAHYVAGRQMIEYPLNALEQMGVDDPVVVTSLRGACDLSKIEGRFRIQPEPTGMADALGRAAPIEGVFPVLCGDVYFDPAPPVSKVPALIYHDYEFAHQHTVWDPETNELIEKPKQLGGLAIVAYWFDEQVFDVIKDIMPSCRGELEFLDIYSYYLSQGCDMLPYEGFFGDMGTPEGLIRVEEHINAN